MTATAAHCPVDDWLLGPGHPGAAVS